MLGIINNYQVAADVAVTNSTTLVSTGLTAQLAAGQTMHFKALIPFSVGAAGGIRVQAVVPAAPTDFKASVLLANTVAPSVTVAQQVTSAAFTNAAANAGNHYIQIEGTVTNGANAGTLDIQFAQNTGDNTPCTVLRGAWMVTTIL